MYPWGDAWDATKCNNRELDLSDTTPVGIFPDGASPYGCLDMSGNVLEWTSTIWGLWDEKKRNVISQYPYPYNVADGRESLEGDNNTWRVLRGGSFDNYRGGVRSAYRLRYNPDLRRFRGIGFRILVARISH